MITNSLWCCLPRLLARLLRALDARVHIDALVMLRPLHSHHSTYASQLAICSLTRTVLLPPPPNCRLPLHSRALTPRCARATIRQQQLSGEKAGVAGGSAFLQCAPVKEELCCCRGSKGGEQSLRLPH